jgi:hypothetical protein
VMAPAGARPAGAITDDSDDSPADDRRPTRA